MSRIMILCELTAPFSSFLFEKRIARSTTKNIPVFPKFEFVTALTRAMLPFSVKVIILPNVYK
jgi:hypothetical protein